MNIQGDLRLHLERPDGTISGDIDFWVRRGIYDPINQKINRRAFADWQNYIRNGTPYTIPAIVEYYKQIGIINSIDETVRLDKCLLGVADG